MLFFPVYSDKREGICTKIPHGAHKGWTYLHQVFGECFQSSRYMDNDRGTSRKYFMFMCYQLYFIHQRLRNFAIVASKKHRDFRICKFTIAVKIDNPKLKNCGGITMDLVQKVTFSPEKSWTCLFLEKLRLNFKHIFHYLLLLGCWSHRRETGASLCKFLKPVRNLWWKYWPGLKM